MELRPLSDRVEGIDDALVDLLRRSSPDITTEDEVLLRVACASYIKIHGDVLDRLGDGEEPIWLVADGLIPFWPEARLGEEQIVGGLPKHGVETLPVAHAVLMSMGTDRSMTLAAAAKVVAAVDAVGFDDEVLTETVTMEILNDLVFAGIAAGEDS